MHDRIGSKIGVFGSHLPVVNGETVVCRHFHRTASGAENCARELAKFLIKVEYIKERKRMFGDDILFLQMILSAEGLYNGLINGVEDQRTIKALNEFVKRSRQIVSIYGSFDNRSEENIATLRLHTQIQARQFLSSVLEKGYDIQIVCGTRTYKMQEELYAQGRETPGPIVTNSKPGHSWHNFGIAWDIGIFEESHYLQDSPLYKEIGIIGLQKGLDWGGVWATNPYKPHYQIKLNKSKADLRNLFEQGELFVLGDIK